MKTGFVLRMARRESRASRRRLALLTAAVAIGVAALVAINGFTANLRQSVAAEARALLGADLSFESRQAPSDSVQLAVRAVGGTRATVTSFSAMAYAPRSETARLTQVSAVVGGWPFYGRIETVPDSAWTALQHGRRAVVDPSLLATLGLSLGDSMSVGDARFAVVGTIAAVPGDVGIRSAFGPRAFINGAYLDATGLLGFGARVEYATFVRLPPEADAQQLAAEWRPRLRGERVRVRTVADDQARLDNTLTRLANFLGLVALIALLLGGLGVASAVHVYIRGKLDTIAILRCLGATARQLLAVYLLQALLLALAGSLIGAAAGLVVQRLLPALLADLLPVNVTFHPSWQAAATGTAIGLWVAAAFAMMPLLAVRQVPPLAALRRDVEPEGARRDPWRLVAILMLSLTVAVLAVHQAGRLRTGLAFAAAVAVVLLLLRLASAALMGLARRVARPLPFAARQGVANLRRPGNQTTTVILSMGFGAFLLASLLLVQHTLLRALDVASPSSANPNMVLFDIQPSQLAGVDSILRADSVAPASPVAIVPMRIAAINGQPSATLLADSSRRGGWALRREYRSTWRDTLVRSERLVAGQWWRGPAGDTTRISIEQDVAQELSVGVGDEITWDVQGRQLPSRIASIREVDWTRFEPNFFVVFEPGALERAPHTWVTLARVESPRLRGRLPRALAGRFPNVTTLDLTFVQDAVGRLVGRVTMAIRFMAVFSLLTGLVVLVGAVATSRFQRVQESVLLRTLGASRRQLVTIAVVEHAVMGLVAGTAALCLGVAAAWALARWVFAVPMSIPPLGAAAVIFAATLATAAVGIWTALDVARQTPLSGLRAVAEG